MVQNFSKNNLLIFTNHSFKRYAERILISDSVYREKLEKMFGHQYWLEHIMLSDLLHSEMAVGSQETKIMKDFVRGGSPSVWMENYGKGWVYYSNITGNAFICAKENPYLVVLTCFKYDSSKNLMNPAKWFYNRGMNSAVYKNYFQKAKNLISEYGIKSKTYKQNEIGYLNENQI